MSTHARSEITKVLSALCTLSFEDDQTFGLRMGIDYGVLNDSLEIKVETSYNRYRMWCGRMHDVPLFNNVEAFRIALSNYGPLVNNNVTKSPLRDDGNTQVIVSLDLVKLRKEGVSSFRK